MLISLIILLVVVGAILYLVNSVLPIDARFKTIINVLVIVGVFIYVLTAFVPALHLTGLR